MAPFYKKARRERAALSRDEGEAGPATLTTSTQLANITEDQSMREASSMGSSASLIGSPKDLLPEPARVRLKHLKETDKQVKQNNTKFKQQAFKVKMQCWQSPKCMMVFGPIWFILFITFGALLLEESEKLIVSRVTYACYDLEDDCPCDRLPTCTVNLTVPEHSSKMKTQTRELVLYYELSGFKQNHRRYQPSYVVEEMRYGQSDFKEEPASFDMDSCHPRDNGISTAPYPNNVSRMSYGVLSGGRSINKGAIGNPCGVHTAWVFNDVVTVRSAEGLALGTEFNASAPGQSIHYNSTDPRFVWWMRTSPYTLRKPLTTFPDDLPAGVYSVDIDNSYAPGIFRGKKSLVLAQYSGVGSRDSTHALGIVGVLVGTLGFAIALVAIGLDKFKKSPLRKGCKKMVAELEELQRQEVINHRVSQRHDVPWLSNAVVADPDAPTDMDDAIRRGIDLIERYAAAPTIEALEGLMAGRTNDGGLLSAAARMKSVSRANLNLAARSQTAPSDEDLSVSTSPM